MDETLASAHRFVDEMTAGDWAQLIIGLLTLSVSAVAIVVSLVSNSRSKEANTIARAANKIAQLTSWRDMITRLGEAELDAIVEDRRLLMNLSAPPPKDRVQILLLELQKVREDSGSRLEKLAMIDAEHDLREVRATVDAVWDSALDTGAVMKDDVRKALIARYDAAVAVFVQKLRALMIKSI